MMIAIIKPMLFCVSAKCNQNMVAFFSMLILLIAVIGYPGVARANEIIYEIRSLGTGFTPTDINDDGLVVGTQSNQATLYDGQFHTLITTPSTATAISNIGRIVGSYETLRSPLKEAFYLDFPDLGASGLLLSQHQSGIATGVNENGRVVGVGVDSSAATSGFSLVGTILSPLILNGGMPAELVADINNANAIVGAYQDADDGQLKSYIHSANGFTDSIEELAAMPNAAVAINDTASGNEQVVGWYEDELGKKGYLYESQRLVTINPLSGDNLIPKDINNGGQVVGTSSIVTTDGLEEAFRAFLFSETDNVVDLNNIVNYGEPWELEEAIAINRFGAIVGAGTLNGAANTAFLLSPFSPYEQLQYPVSQNRPDVQVGEHFGSSVAISGDTMVVGAPHKSVSDADGVVRRYAGAAYIYQLQDGVWQEIARLTEISVSSNAFFGISVAIEGDFVAIGTPIRETVYVYNRNGNNNWNITNPTVVTPSDNVTGARFGAAIAMHGETLIVGAPFHSEKGFHTGAAYIYEADSEGAWVEKEKLLPEGRFGRDRFGSSVAVHQNSVVVGAPENVNQWVGNGYIYTFNKDITGSWREGQKITSPIPEKYGFGISVSISNDTMLIGTSSAGVVYLYSRYAENEWQLKDSLRRKSRFSPQGFGASVTMSNNNIIIIGSQYESDTAPTSESLVSGGAVYIFQQSGGYWQQRKRITLENPANHDRFGYAVAIDGDVFVVGAPFKDDVGVNAGGVSVYHAGCSAVCAETERVDLAVDITPNNASVVVQDEFAATVTISNLDGVNSATSLQLKSKLPLSFSQPANDICHYDSVLHNITCSYDSILPSDSVEFNVSLYAPTSPGDYELTFCAQASTLDLFPDNDCKTVTVNVVNGGEPSVLILKPASGEVKDIFDNDPVMMLPEIKNWVVRAGDSYYKVYVNDAPPISRYNKQAFDISQSIKAGENTVRVVLTNADGTEAEQEHSVTFTVSYKVPCVAFNKPEAKPEAEAETKPESDPEVVHKFVRQVGDEVLLDFSLCHWELSPGRKHVDMFVQGEYDKTLDFYQPIDVSHFNDGNYEITLRLAQGLEGEAEHQLRAEYDSINIDLKTQLPVVEIVAPSVGSTPIVVGPNKPVTLTFDIQHWTMSQGGKHFRWYLDGIDQGVGYETGSIAIGYGGLETGTHEIRIALFPGDNQSAHSEASVSFEVVRNLPDINVTQPVSGATLSATQQNVNLVYDVAHLEQVPSGSLLRLYINGGEGVDVEISQTNMRIPIEWFDVGPGNSNDITMKIIGSDASIISEATVSDLAFSDTANVEKPAPPPGDSGGSGGGVFNVSWIFVLAILVYWRKRELIRVDFN